MQCQTVRSCSTSQQIQLSHRRGTFSGGDRNLLDSERSAALSDRPSCAHIKQSSATSTKCSSQYGAAATPGTGLHASFECAPAAAGSAAPIGSYLSYFRSEVLRGYVLCLCKKGHHKDAWCRCQHRPPPTIAGH